MATTPVHAKDNTEQACEKPLKDSRMTLGGRISPTSWNPNDSNTECGLNGDLKWPDSTLHEGIEHIIVRPKSPWLIF